MLVGVLLPVLLLAARPIPSAVFTIKVSDDGYTPGSLVRTTSVPNGSIIFEDEEEILTTIATDSHEFLFCSVSMNSQLGRLFEV